MPYSERSNNFACSIVSGCRCTKGSEELEAKQVYANKTMANVVMTYLNYGVFDIQLSNRVIPQVRHGAFPMKVVSSVLDPSSIQKIALRLLKSQKPPSIDISKVLAREAECSKMQPANQYSFLLYARLYWVHSTLCVIRSKTRRFTDLYVEL
ncbi:hypothetical protein BFJ68_g17268 [Fusarium oxysporum]|uniref:Uncharacterized protein n=1 Tax=Fusarium oxysporum TaxID=5507 RepID=A0A420NYZ1_FUSOX|nr:hypothetical protein BFJ68_g17268 [Fusarium oxysporum]